jgi:hypothetical protein
MFLKALNRIKSFNAFILSFDWSFNYIIECLTPETFESLLDSTLIMSYNCNVGTHSKNEIKCFSYNKINLTLEDLEFKLWLLCLWKLWLEWQHIFSLIRGKGHPFLDSSQNIPSNDTAITATHSVMPSTTF